MAKLSPRSSTSGPQRSRTVTMRDVARVAGVSAITVSRALTAPHKVSAVTAQRVKEAVAATGYVPNLAAGTLRSARSGLVVVLVPTIKGFFTHMIDALNRSVTARGLQLVLAQSGYDATREADLVRTLIGRRPDAIVLTGVKHASEIRALLQTSGIPVVETWDITPEPIDMLVSLSHEKISRQVARHFIGQGRRHLAVISGNDERAIRRNRVFTDTVRRAGLRPPAIVTVPAPTTHAAGRAALRQLREQAADTDAVFCSSDDLALGVLTEAGVLGVAIPRDLAVVGAGDSDLGASVVPSLTTVGIDGAAMGRAVAEMIFARVEGGEPAERVVHLEFGLVRRESG